jgi:hypothetical protein
VRTPAPAAKAFDYRWAKSAANMSNVRADCKSLRQMAKFSIELGPEFEASPAFDGDGATVKERRQRRSGDDPQVTVR